MHQSYQIIHIYQVAKEIINLNIRV